RPGRRDQGGRRPATPGVGCGARDAGGGRRIGRKLGGQPAEVDGAVVASHSPNGGRIWPAPATVAAPLAGNEQPAITASPTRAGHAYLAFANFLSPDALPRTNPLQFSRTTDGGATWSPPVLIDQPSPFAIDFAPKILVLPDGTLLAVFARADFEAGLGYLYAARSPR
ncbi:MAG: sialidase family protein, partial [Streptosporangiaceae bacterium]